MLWLCSKSSPRMFLLCSLWKHLSHSHTKSHSLLWKRHLYQWMVNRDCCTCYLHCQSIMLNMCVWMIWVVSLSSHVRVWFHDHLCIFWSFTHLVIFVEVLTTRLPSDSRTITPPSNGSTFNQNSAEASSNLFKLCFLQEIQSTFILTTRKSPWDWLPSKIA